MQDPLSRPFFPEQALCKALFLSPCLSLFLLVFVLASDALAHRVNVFAWVDGTALRIECGFGGGAKVKNGLVEVRDATSGKVRATTRTSGDGTAAVSITQEMLDAEDGLVVLLDAGEGHRNTWTVSREELAAGGPGNEAGTTVTASPKDSPKDSVKDSANNSRGEFPPASAKETQAPARKNLNADRSSEQAPGQDAGLLLRMGEEELSRLVDERLEAKIAPLRHMLAESVLGGPKLSDIVGGIGWILGLFGVWALTRRRI